MTRMSRVVFVCVLLLAFVAVAGAQIQRGIILRPKVQLQTASPLVLSKRFETLLKEHNVATTKQSTALNQFRSLPTSLQQDLLGTMDEKAATQLGIPNAMLPQYKYVELLRIKPGLVILRRISGFFPEEGSPGCWAYAFGMPWSDACQVVFDGTPVETHYLGFNIEFFPNSLAFTVPAGATTGADHDVKVIWEGTSNETPTVQYHIVAPRGYRGYWGWQFHNFGDPAIPWHLYRDFFGASAVEYPNGTHRPSAQAWYDSSYKGVGGGGNCYGMTVSSMRARQFNITTYHHAWFAAHAEPYTWPYPWCTETKQTAQEDQGGQLSAEMSYYINHYYNHQSHQQAWQRCHDLVFTANDHANICFWSATGGHSVVGYGTEVDGTKHYIRMYDNNAPYTETETGGPHKSLSYVDYANGSFTYPGKGYNKMICLSYSECLEGPSLPAAASGVAGATAVCVVNGGTVRQISDGQGHTFFNANGTENTNPATRIPDSMRFLPLTGEVSAFNYPGVFIFNQASGKDLTFNVEGGGAKSLSMFMAGDVMEVEFSGQGQIICNDILTNTRALEVPAPDALRPTSIRCIKVLANERVYRLLNLRNLGPTSLIMQPTVNGNALNVQSKGAVQFDLNAATFAAGQVQEGLFRNIGLATNQVGVLQPGNWNALGTTQLNLQIRNLQTKQQIRNIRIEPGH